MWRSQSCNCFQSRRKSREGALLRVRTRNREVSKHTQKCINSVLGACSVSGLVTFSQQGRHQSYKSAVRGASREGHSKRRRSHLSSKGAKLTDTKRWNQELRVMLQSCMKPVLQIFLAHFPSLSRGVNPVSATYSCLRRVRGEKTGEPPEKQLISTSQQENEDAPPVIASRTASNQHRAASGRGSSVPNYKSTQKTKLVREEPQHSQTGKFYPTPPCHDDTAGQTPSCGCVTAKKHSVNVSKSEMCLT